MGADRFVLREKNIVLIYMVHIAYEGDKRQGKHLKNKEDPPPPLILIFLPCSLVQGYQIWCPGHFILPHRPASAQLYNCHIHCQCARTWGAQNDRMAAAAVHRKSPRLPDSLIGDPVAT
jgi:hypothetical protein